MYVRRICSWEAIRQQQVLDLTKQFIQHTLVKCQWRLMAVVLNQISLLVVGKGYGSRVAIHLFYSLTS